MSATVLVGEYRTMRFAYADPPYIGQAKKHYDCPEIDHRELIDRLVRDFPDGWVLSASATTLHQILDLAPADVRVGIWVKPLVFFRPGVNPCYGWEPVIWSGGRKRGRLEPTAYDWVSVNTTFGTGTHGAKPPQFCYWLFGLLNMRPGDELVDMFPGSGAVTKAWERWQRQPRLLPRREKVTRARLRADAPLFAGAGQQRESV